MGLGQYNSLGEYCGLSTASSMFLISIHLVRQGCKGTCLTIRMCILHVSALRLGVISKTDSYLEVVSEVGQTPRGRVHRRLLLLVLASQTGVLVGEGRGGRTRGERTVRGAWEGTGGPTGGVCVEGFGVSMEVNPWRVVGGIYGGGAGGRAGPPQTKPPAVGGRGEVVIYGSSPYWGVRGGGVVRGVGRL